MILWGCYFRSKLEGPDFTCRGCGSRPGAAVHLRSILDVSFSLAETAEPLGACSALLVAVLGREAGAPRQGQDAADGCAPGGTGVPGRAARHALQESTSHQPCPLPAAASGHVSVSPLADPMPSLHHNYHENILSLTSSLLGS